MYAKQLLNGLEVSDGDVNLNIDAHGRVISWGNSFHPGKVPSLDGDSSSRETERVCATLKQTLDTHKAELAAQSGSTGAWGLVKSAAQVFLPGLVTESAPVDLHAVKQLEANVRKVQLDHEALCGKPALSTEMIYPVDALLHLLARIHPADGLKEEPSEADFSSMPQHHFTPKPAPAEPATELISGPGLTKAGILSDVPARLMYTQTSHQDIPALVWKLEVELKDNWYEAYVDAKSGELVRIVDWANDYTWSTGETEGALKGGKQKPLPVPTPPKHITPYTYQVYPWGKLL